jgi:carbamoyl-phosphate synthase large subunit
MNVQYAVQISPDDPKLAQVYILEANPRASRTVPYVSKAIGVPLVSYASRIMAGETLAQIGFTAEVVPGHIAIKEAVLPLPNSLAQIRSWGQKCVPLVR